MLRQSQLILLLDRVLNQSAHIRKGNEAVYFCPLCNHYKKKLEVNVETEYWHCWVCNKAGRSIRSLFRRMKVNRSFYAELNKISLYKNNFESTQNDSEEKSVILSLPEEFSPMNKIVNSQEYKNALSYIKNRGIRKEDILRYNIGYCETGEYRHRIIIPSYDKDGNVNFFSARTYYDASSYKYMLPSWSKNIIGNEIFVNWDEPISLIEGGFDAIAIRRNSIPLFGTTMSSKLKEAIIENGVWRVNIILDNDALKNAVKIYDYIEKLKVHEIDVHLIRLEDKDPSILGFEKIDQIINESKPMDVAEMMKLKLSL